MTLLSFLFFPFCSLIHFNSFQASSIVLLPAPFPSLSSSLLFCSFVIFYPLLFTHLLYSALLSLTRFHSSLFNPILFILHFYFPFHLLFSPSLLLVLYSPPLFSSSVPLSPVIPFVFCHTCNIKEMHTHWAKTDLA